MPCKCHGTGDADILPCEPEEARRQVITSLVTDTRQRHARIPASSVFPPENKNNPRERLQV